MYTGIRIDEEVGLLSDVKLTWMANGRMWWCSIDDSHSFLQPDNDPAAYDSSPTKARLTLAMAAHRNDDESVDRSRRHHEDSRNPWQERRCVDLLGRLPVDDGAESMGRLHIE